MTKKIIWCLNNWKAKRRNSWSFVQLQLVIYALSFFLSRSLSFSLWMELNESTENINEIYTLEMNSLWNILVFLRTVCWINFIRLMYLCPYGMCVCVYLELCKWSYFVITKVSQFVLFCAWRWIILCISSSLSLNLKLLQDVHENLIIFSWNFHSLLFSFIFPIFWLLFIRSIDHHNNHILTQWIPQPIHIF